MSASHPLLGALPLTWCLKPWAKGGTAQAPRAWQPAQEHWAMPNEHLTKPKQQAHGLWLSGYRAMCLADAPWPSSLGPGFFGKASSCSTSLQHLRFIKASHLFCMVCIIISMKIYISEMPACLAQSPSTRQPRSTLVEIFFDMPHFLSQTRCFPYFPHARSSCSCPFESQTSGHSFHSGKR